MSPIASSVGFPAVDWTLDLSWPVKPTVPTAAGAGIGGMFGARGYPWGMVNDATWSWNSGSFAGGGASQGETQSGVWCCTLDGVAGTGNAGLGFRLSPWLPTFDNANCPDPDDVSQRIFWLKGWFLEDPANADPTIADALGVQLLPDDGLAFSSATWPVAANGGFGIFRRVGNDGYRWASYSGAPALLESIDLATGTGWHSSDIIIRQATLGDVSTPWLTLRWDETDVITERPFGHAALPTPQSIRANAHSLALLTALFPTDTGRMGCRLRLRVGRFHPDGYPQP